MFDVIFYLDPSERVLRIEWNNAQLEKIFGAVWSVYVGGAFPSAFIPEADGKKLHWKDEEFFFYRFPLPEGGSALFMKRDDHMEFFLKAALDTFSESVQIYDRNAMAVYFNTAGLDSMDFPQTAVENKHVLELFEVEADYSTVLTALRTQSRIVNRFDRYRTRSGVPMTAVNNAWPVFSGGKLLGVVDTEMDMGMVESKARELTEIEKALKKNRQQANYLLRRKLSELPAESAAMRKLIERAVEAAAREENILITGAPGTGKDMLASSIHASGSRSEKEMAVMNCAAVPEEMQEEMLFGDPSAPSENAGLLEKADGGILLLQEVGRLSLRVQGLLLKAMQDGWVAGASGRVPARLQIISTSSEDLSALVETNSFRIDLYYRLSVYTLTMPLLAERTEDIEKLILSRIRHNTDLAIFGNSFSDISPEALAVMKAYDWPGNLKELNYAVDYAMSKGKGPSLLAKDLPLFLTESSAATEKNAADFVPGNLRDAVDEFERNYINSTLRHFDGNVSKSAAALGLKRQSLQYRLRKEKG